MQHSVSESLGAAISRRSLFSGLGCGPAGIALLSLLNREARGDESRILPDQVAKARNVIWLFMRGGVSHLESFDPKPAVDRYAGLTIAETPFAEVQNPDRLKQVRVVVVNDANGQQRNRLFPLQVGFRRYGESGTPVSDWFPSIGSMADEIAVIRSMWTTDDNHGAQVQFHSGRHMLEPRVPTIGAWIKWGLGSLNDELPSFISMGPRYFDVRDGHYLGPAYDAVTLNVNSEEPLAYGRPENGLSRNEQQGVLGLTQQLNRTAATEHPGDAALDARIRAYELAYRMQSAVPDVLDLAKETTGTQDLYGLSDEVTRPFGRQLLTARRMVERGVRFVQIMHGAGAAGAWDQHSGLRAGHSRLAAQVDKPIGGLLRDLRQRGLLDETIVVFATEFGRTPGSQNSDGRDHHPFGFSVWLAGGGIRGGVVHGATDELGFHAVESPHYVTDVHATILHQLGLDPHRLQVPGHQRLERDFGHVIQPILA